MELQSWDWPGWLSWHLDDCSWSMGTVRSLWYSVFLLSVLESQIPLQFKWSCGPLFPKCNTVLQYISFGSGGMVHGSQFENADYARKVPHSGMLGCWAIVAYRYKCDGNSTGKNYRSMLVQVHQHAAMMKHVLSKQRALESFRNSCCYHPDRWPSGCQCQGALPFLEDLKDSKLKYSSL